MEPTQSDLQELKRLLALGSTPYVESIFKAEISKLEAKFTSPVAPAPVAEAPAPAQPRKIYTAIDSYAFSDSSDKAEIIIRNIRGLEQAKIEFKPEAHQFQICVLREEQNLPNLRLTVSPLYKKIVPEECKYRIRRETLTITLKKKKSTTWMKLKKSALDAKPKKSADASGSKPAADSDPNTALMDMMKKMYDEGDDEMKRTISKAMWEAQHKKPDEKKE